MYYEKQKEWFLKRYHYRKDNRLCTKCGKPLNEDDNTICKECKDRKNKIAKDSYAYYQNIGICPICHEVKLLPGEKRCAICKRNRNSLIRTDRKRETDSINHKKQRDDRRAKGICTICGEAPADEGYVTCKFCREHKRWVRRRRTIKLIDNSRCTSCGKKIMTGRFRTCLECRQKDVIKRGRKAVAGE